MNYQTYKDNQRKFRTSWIPLTSEDLESLFVEMKQYLHQNGYRCFVNTSHNLAYSITQLDEAEYGTNYDYPIAGECYHGHSFSLNFDQAMTLNPCLKCLATNQLVIRWGDLDPNHKLSLYTQLCGWTKTHHWKYAETYSDFIQYLYKLDQQPYDSNNSLLPITCSSDHVQEITFHDFFKSSNVTYLSGLQCHRCLHPEWYVPRQGQIMSLISIGAQDIYLP